MHPILATKTRFGLYLLVWILPVGMLVYLLSIPGKLGWPESAALAAPLCLIYAFICLSPWYLCRFLPLWSTGIEKLLLNYVSAGVVVGLLWTVLAYGLAVPLARFFPGLETRLGPHLPVVFGMGVLLYLLAVALHYVVLSAQASKQAEILAREAELKALKAQINPHFLFNCLHSISALTSGDPAGARDMCIRLSDFLRNTLRLGERETIPWREELALVRSYLEIEQIRFGARLRVEFEVTESCDDCDVPALLLQPLVENAVKHGIATLVEGGVVRLTARAGDGGLLIAIENPFDPESPVSGRNGLGLRNVRGRLDARFGNGATLETHVEEGRFRVDVRVPCRAAGT